MTRRVTDPAGSMGARRIEAADESEVRELQANDPAIKAEIGLRYETLPILRAIVRG